MSASVKEETLMTVGELCELIQGRLVNGGDRVGPDTPIHSMYGLAENKMRGNAVYFCLLQDWNQSGREALEKSIRRAISLGAMALVSQYPIQDGKGQDFPTILVDSVVGSLVKTGRTWRDKFPIRSAGVTGTCGKTTTKQLLCCALEEKYHIHSSYASRNTLPSVFQLCLKLKPEHELYVQEVSGDTPMGTGYSTEILDPSVSIVTNIGMAHLDKYESIEALAAEKLKLARGLRPDGLAILNKDDPILAKADVGRKTVYVSVEDPTSDYYVKDVVMKDRKLSLTVVDNYTGPAPKEYPMQVALAGRHNAFNIGAAFAAAQFLGVPEDQIIQGFSKFTTTGYRQNIVNWGGYTLIMDCFSVSEAAMVSGVQMLCDLPSKGRRIAVLGAKAHFGDFQDQLQINAAKKLKDMPVDEFICYGEHTKLLSQELKRYGCKGVTAVPSMEQLIAMLSQLKQGDTILFKSGMQECFTFVADMVFGTSFAAYSEYYCGSYSKVYNEAPWRRRVFHCHDTARAVIEKYTGDEKSIRLTAPVHGAPVGKIAKQAFKGRSLEEVTCGSSLAGIDKEAFAGCTSLRTVRLEEGLRNIGPQAFAGCTALESVTLPHSLIQIGAGAFQGCTALREVHVPGSAKVDKHAFDGCPGVRVVTRTDAPAPAVPVRPAPVKPAAAMPSLLRRIKRKIKRLLKGGKK